MFRFRLYYDKDKEEEFLNEMSAKGYAMKSYFLGLYAFEECNPNEYTYRIDLINDMTLKERKELYELVRESGGEHVQSWGFWAFFRKRGKFELYSDRESQIHQYERIRLVFLALAFLEVISAVQQWIRLGWENTSSERAFAMIFTALSTIFIYQVIITTIKINKLKRTI
ncbi:DUF2812 domain-containing protein [Youngiibacter multivorans]|uniref:DUF2812 domain-containing protein n=1 Tax=Youngiibacter multivorans TaxID=937251 RepID=A0ABS4G145_9CLOT|nr:DUF2812 domain-containing protein [Youngiibacter multivorans]MBP1918263.1 hypothetical protein [Youngiibacter multivorans]